MKAVYKHLKGKRKIAPVVNRCTVDPTGTMPLRRRFTDELNHIWNALRLDVFNYSASQARDARGRWTSDGGSGGTASQDQFADLRAELPPGVSLEQAAKATTEDLKKAYRSRWKQMAEHGVELYHGTADSYLSSIMKYGLTVRKKQQGGDAWAKRHGLNDFTRFEVLWPGRKHSVYMTDNHNFASQMAATAANVAHARPVVLTVGIPASEIRKLHPDEMASSGNPYNSPLNVRFEGDIKPAWIKHAEFPQNAVTPSVGGKHTDNAAYAADGERTYRVYIVALIADPDDISSVQNYNPAQPRDAHGEWTAGGGAEFVSPNIQEHLDFSQAGAAIGGPRHALYREMARDVDEATGLHGHGEDVIGAWADGAENSTMLTTNGPVSMEQLRANAAMKGHLSRQKQVLIFHEEEGGPHALLESQATGNLADLHRDLLQSGVPFHTLIPSADGKSAKIVVADLDGSALQPLHNFAERHNSYVERVPGRAEFVGIEKQDETDTEQRDDAQRIYEQIISQTPGAQAVWQGLRHRWSQQLSQVHNRRTQSATIIASCLDPKLWGKYLHAAYQQGVQNAFERVHQGQRSQITNVENAATYLGARQNFTANTLRLSAKNSLTKVYREYHQRCSAVQNVFSQEGYNQLATLARLGAVRAHAEGQLDAYRQLGISRVKLHADNAGCSHLHNAVFNLDEARGQVPRHTTCRCCWQPAENFNPAEPRDEHGKWIAGGSTAGYSAADMDDRLQRAGIPPEVRSAWQRLNPEGAKSGKYIVDYHNAKDWVNELQDAKPPGIDYKIINLSESRDEPLAKRPGSSAQPPEEKFSSYTIDPSDPEAAKLSSGHIVDIHRTDMSGVNSSYIVTMDNGEKGILKPANGEDPNLRDGVPKYEQYKREAAAYEAAKVLGFQDLVPPTVLIHDEKRGPSSLQKFVPNAKVALRAGYKRKYDGENDLKRAAAFDYIIGNMDRHEGNWMVTDDDKLQLIDNGLSFPINYQDTFRNQDILEEAQLHREIGPDRNLAGVGYTIPHEFADLKDRWPQLASALDKVGIEPKALDLMKERLENLSAGAARGRKFQDLSDPWNRRTTRYEDSQGSSARSSNKKSFAGHDTASKLKRIGLKEGTRDAIYALNPRTGYTAKLSKIRVPAKIYDYHKESLEKAFPEHEIIPVVT